MEIQASSSPLLTKHARTDSPPRYLATAAFIRDKIRRGVWKPGDLLPAHTEMMKLYKVGNNTIHEAIETLVLEGYLTVTRKKGTLVVPKPPHLHRLAVVFPFNLPVNQSWSPFYIELAHQAENLENQSPFYADLFCCEDQSDTTVSSRQLEYHVRSKSLAGLIFATIPFTYMQKAPLTEPNIPRVAIMPDHSYKTIPGIVWFDFRSFAEKSIEYCLSQGRQKIAMFTRESPAPPDCYHEYFRAGMAKRNIPFPEYWIQMGDLEPKRIIHLLMNPDQTRRPDALIVTDDTLLEPVMAGLISAGIRVPDDLLVLCHTNFPQVQTSVMPVVRLGYDVREVFSACIKLIYDQKNGNFSQQCIRVPALFAKDFNNAP